MRRTRWCVSEPLTCVLVHLENVTKHGVGMSRFAPLQQLCKRTAAQKALVQMAVPGFGSASSQTSLTGATHCPAILQATSCQVDSRLGWMGDTSIELHGCDAVSSRPDSHPGMGPLCCSALCPGCPECSESPTGSKLYALNSLFPALSLSTREALKVASRVVGSLLDGLCHRHDHTSLSLERLTLASSLFPIQKCWF